VYHGPEEPDVDGMSEHDIAVNKGLAAHIVDNVMKWERRPDSEPYNYQRRRRVLDVGSKHPVLANAIQELVFSSADTMDPMGGTIAADFESYKVSPRREDSPRYDLITMIHVFEHLYDPLAALRKLRLMIADDGRVFLRLPDHSVPGWERDLTPHHFQIHPFIHSFTSILEALAQSPTFVVESRAPMVGYGQCDIVLRPI
jgi:hypothetical protein